MKTKYEEFEVLIPKADGSGVVEKVKVTIPLRWDEEVREWLMTPEAHEIIEDTKARHMGLLLPPQFRELRERFKLSQKEMGELFQVGEKSWTRWESGKHRPSRSINLLIRALYEGAISINYLLNKAGKRSNDTPLTGQAFCTALEVWKAAGGKCTAPTPDLLYCKGSSQVIVQFKASFGKNQFLKHILKSIHHHGPMEQPPHAGSKRAAKPSSRTAPTHTYPQPRLNFPTLA